MNLHHVDVLVAGGGPVGLASALFVHAQGRSVIVAEEQPRGVTHSCALALHPQTLDLLEEAGAAEAIMAKARHVGTLAIYAGARRELTVPVAAPGSRHPQLAVLGQDVLERELAAELRRRRVPVWRNHRLARFDQDAGMVSAQLDEIEDRLTGYAVAHFDRVVRRTHFVGAEYLIGADGHGSFVRRHLDIAFPEVGRPQHFAVFEFQTGTPLADEVALVLHEDGISALWPLPDGRARWSFAVDPGTHPGARRIKDHDPVQVVGGGIYPALSRTLLEQLLRERAPWFQAKIEHIYWRVLVRFERRLVPRFGHGRTWLAGDAAHLTGPVGMQSMNVGIAEAHALADAMLAGSSVPDRDRLREFGDASLNRWRYLLGLAGGPEVDATAPAEIARHKDELLACLPGSGDALAAMAAGLRLRLPPERLGANSASSVG